MSALCDGKMSFQEENVKKRVHQGGGKGKDERGERKGGGRERGKQ